jgi:hypothetical protein
MKGGKTMMTLAKTGRKIFGIWGIVGILVISTCFLMTLIQNQEAYAETKKVSGTIKYLPNLARNRVPIPNCEQHLNLTVRQAILSSDDQDWNNARIFELDYLDFGKDPDKYSGYGSILHPGGDQTFYKFTGKVTSGSGADSAGETEGFFIRGTGKFEDIRARWLLKWTFKMAEGMTGEWAVEYF